ncbi:DUF2894 domain-containing protein [Acidovorax radicis]|uniref:DUF2894 domain-containing protein n=1 Tax=Acidovorax radicis TaxID=758826 RepID=UPI001CFBA948|nr:DUF2894 domain-containing protein [Acidovorax radicis]UCU99994.1 DUF2894 domain-containing protein [Acidovorax radicis]
MSDSTLESLRSEGAHQHDPVRFRYLETLDRRMRLQPAAVQVLLERKLHEALVAYQHDARTLQAAPNHAQNHAPKPPAENGLSQLNRDLNTRARADANQALVDGTQSMSDLRSVRQFSEVWSKISAEKQVTQALHAGPENAGPLNSHKLMLRSLNLMRTLSPDYLRHFWAQMDSLLWMERMNAGFAAPSAKPARQGRTKLKL